MTRDCRFCLDEMQVEKISQSEFIHFCINEKCRFYRSVKDQYAEFESVDEVIIEKLEPMFKELVETYL